MNCPDLARERFRELPKTKAAIAYATRMHDGQERQIDGAPFIVHPLEVAALLYEACAPDYLIAAGVLHDTIEKTDARLNDLRERFGARVATLVLAVSEDKHINGYTRRKAALREQVASAGEEALVLFAADKLSKSRELRIEPAPVSQPHARKASAVRSRRLTHYRHCLRLLEDQIPDSLLVGYLRTELGTLPDRAAREPMLDTVR